MSSGKQIGLLYTKDPLSPHYAMDLIRWHALAQALSVLSYRVDMITVLGQSAQRCSPSLRIVPLDRVRWEEYDIVKACYQSSIAHVPPHDFTIVRLARVIGCRACSRDRQHVEEHLAYQDRIALQARIILVNDEHNRRRWKRFYGDAQEVHLLPTGCPATIPAPDRNPFEEERPVALFMGSLSSRRVVTMLNRIGAQLVKRGWTLAVIGQNKTAYYCRRPFELDERCCRLLPPVPHEASWNYLLHATVGVALAPGPLIFENESSKLYAYLRTGLPVACEERISNADLVSDRRWGTSFPYGDATAAVDGIVSLGNEVRFRHGRDAMVHDFVREHSWTARARTLVEIIEGVYGTRRTSGGRASP